ncbi:hypothetical protein [Mannheimia pernigra]|nr:hypothetical protein [Mannheimia pernigra]
MQIAAQKPFKIGLKKMVKKMVVRELLNEKSSTFVELFLRFT